MTTDERETLEAVAEYYRTEGTWPDALDLVLGGYIDDCNPTDPDEEREEEDRLDDVLLDLADQNFLQSTGHGQYALTFRGADRLNEKVDIA
jgi:hypothetical protein